MQSRRTNRFTRPTALFVPLALAGALALSSCAAVGWNKGQLVLSRNVTFGQELIDLKKAHDMGALSDEEYLVIKRKIMDLVDNADVDKVMDMNWNGSGDRDEDEPED